MSTERGGEGRKGGKRTQGKEGEGEEEGRAEEEGQERGGMGVSLPNRVTLKSPMAVGHRPLGLGRVE